MALTIRLTEKEQILIENLKSNLDIKTSSMALIKAAEIVVNEFPKLKAQFRTLSSILKDSEDNYKKLESLLIRKIQAEKEIEEIYNLINNNAINNSEDQLTHDQQGNNI